MTRIDTIAALTKKALWLSNWMIHHANHIRPNTDGVKVGGHQASSASMAAIMSALYFGVLKPEDRVAVKPHASPVFHAIQYLFGRPWRSSRTFGPLAAPNPIPAAPRTPMTSTYPPVRLAWALPSPPLHH
jgi:hypothetical protein